MSGAVWTLPYRTRVLGLCMAVYFGARLAVATLATLGPTVVDGLGITLGAFGLAFTGLSVASALAQLPSGALGDRYGERRTIAAAAGLAAASAVALATARTYPGFLALSVLVGVAGGLYYSPSTTLLARLYADTGRAIGAYRVSGQVAGIVAPPVAGVLGARYGWRTAVFATGLALVPVMAGLVVGLRPTPPRAPEASLGDRLDPAALRSTLARPEVAFSTALAGAIQFVDVATFAFLPAILGTHHGLDAGAASALYALYFGVVATVQPVTGWAADRVGRDAATVATLVAGTLGYAALSTPLPPAGAAVAVVLAGVGMTWATPVQARVLAHLRDDEAGTGFGLVRTAYLLVGSLGGTVVGVVATAATWTAAVGLLAGITLVATVALVAWTRRGRG